MTDDTLDKYLPPVAEREQIAAQQVEQFKRELYGHVLNKQRLEALPADQRDDAANQAIADSDSAIDVIKTAIDNT